LNNFHAVQSIGKPGSGFFNFATQAVGTRQKIELGLLPKTAVPANMYIRREDMQALTGKTSAGLPKKLFIATHTRYFKHEPAKID
jgi:hypothetical protein